MYLHITPWKTNDNLCGPKCGFYLDLSSVLVADSLLFPKVFSPLTDKKEKLAINMQKTTVRCVLLTNVHQTSAGIEC